MKHSTITAGLTALVCAGGLLAAAPASAAVYTAAPASAGVEAAARVPVFRNCTAMHHRYRGGVARPGAHDHRASGHARYTPHVSLALYRANKRLDRDHDGIACEH